MSETNEPKSVMKVDCIIEIKDYGRKLTKTFEYSPVLRIDILEQAKNFCVKVGTQGITHKYIGADGYIYFPPSRIHSIEIEICE